MNALRPRMIQRAARSVTRRNQSTAQGVHNLSPQSAVPPQLKIERMNKANFHENWHLSAVNVNKTAFKDNWLSDPSTFPIIAVLSCAIVFLSGTGVYALTNYRDVRINPSTKHDEIQTRSTQHYRSFTESLGSRNKKYAPFHTEGAGVDHKEWVKRKATERN